MRFFVIAGTIFLGALSAFQTSLGAQVFMTQSEALEKAFPDIETERKTLYLTHPPLTKDNTGVD